MWYHTPSPIRSPTVDFKFAGPSRPKRNHLFWWRPDRPNPTRIIYYYNIVCTSISATRAVQIIVLLLFSTDGSSRARTFQLSQRCSSRWWETTTTTVRAYFRGDCGSRRTMLSKSRGKPIYGRVTCNNMLTIRISHFKITYIIVTDPDDSTRRVWRRCDVYTILSASTCYIMCVYYTYHKL